MIVSGGDNGAAYTQDDGHFALNVRVLGRVDNRRAYGWSVHVEGALLASGSDIGVADSEDEGMHGLKALATLVSFLEADADKYRVNMGPVEPDDDPYLFGDKVAEWAYMNDTDLSMADSDIETEMIRWLRSNPA